MFKNICKFSLLMLRCVVILITLIALTVSGAEAAARLFSAYQCDEQKNNYVIDQVDLLPTPGEASGEMATSGESDSEQPGFIQAPLFLPGFNPGSKSFSQSAFTLENHLPRTVAESNAVLLSSISQISTALGRQLTLVGAKPSGTS